LKRLLFHPLMFLNGFVDRAFALLGAILLAQFPQFFGQYLQRLGGHLDEARRTVAAYETAAAALGLSLEEYIEHHLTSGSELFVSSGRVILGLVERFAQLQASFNALAGADPLTRWWVFLKEAELAIAVQTWRGFTPGVPTTAEGLIYAGAGLLLGWGLFALLKSLARPFWRRFFSSARPENA
jgi:hypothetical protein